MIIGGVFNAMEGVVALARNEVYLATPRYLAALSMLANFAFIPYYPVWSLAIIALNVFVIWALCVYNRDTAATL